MNAGTDAEARLRLAEELAWEAGEVHRRYYRTLDPAAVELKGRRDPVTEADREAEAIIVRGLQAAHPRDAILAEEGGAHPGSSEYEWIVDPLDGTVNFSHGLPMHAVAIAVRRGRELLAAVVYAPQLGETYAATRGGGTTLNGQPVHVSHQEAVHEALLATGFGYRRQEVADNNVDHFNDLILRCRDLRRLGSAALDFALVASGRYDGYWELHLSPWDIAAGVLLVEEAGGVVCDLDGGQEMIERGHVLACNGVQLQAELGAILRSRRP